MVRLKYQIKGVERMNPEKKYYQDHRGVWHVTDHFTGEPVQPEGVELLSEPEPYVFECESISLKKILTFSTDTILDYYSHYHALYELTQDTKFEARAKVYQQAFKTKMKAQEVS
jgi:hypothetical protein